MPRLTRTEGGFVHQFIIILVISIMSGALMAGLALPWVGLLAKGAEATATTIDDDFPLKLNFQPLNERTKVLAADGSQLATFYDENRVYVPLDEISHTMKQAIVAIEDSRFYEHGALDVKGTLRAFVTNQTSDEIVQGGSSITQQLVKLTLLEQATTKKERKAATADTYARKFLELRYAAWVTQHLSKDEILERYLNAAYFGDGAYGIQSAAHHYFNTTAAKLTLPQAALLAGLVRNPTGYDPTNNKDAALQRRNTVINRMYQLHLITTKELHKAKSAKLGLDIQDVGNGCFDASWPLYCDYVKAYLLNDPDLGKTGAQRKQLLYGGGLTIKTALKPKFQKAAVEAVRDHVYAKDHAIGGLAMVEPGTGYVRAIAQSRPLGTDSDDGETFLDYAVPYRYGNSHGFQAGSTFKVFVLAAAIMQGIPLNHQIYSPSTLYFQTGDTWPSCDGPYKLAAPWSPSNSTRSGNMNLYTGTAYSVNTFFVQLEQMTGLCKPWHLAIDMGMKQLKENPRQSRTPTFTLGVTDTSPLAMAEAYATFAARGVHCDSTPILEIRDREGKKIPIHGTQCDRVMKPAYADAVNSVLQRITAPGGFGDDIAPDQPSAGKTGTTNDERAVWFVGYTPNLAAAAMVAGVNEAGHWRPLPGITLAGQPLSFASGSGTAGPIWGQAMKAVEKYLPNKKFVKPDSAAVAGMPVQIPSFYGWDPSDAAKKLNKLGLNPQISSTVNSHAPEGTVAYTDPSGSTYTGATVSIYISSGYVPPPPPPPSPTHTPPPPKPTKTTPTQTTPTQTTPTQTTPTQTTQPPPPEKTATQKPPKPSKTKPPPPRGHPGDQGEDEDG